MKNFNSFFNQLTAMPKRLAMVLTVLFTLGVGSIWGADTWKLVTDASTLKVGDEVVIVASSEDYALSTTQNNNNRGQASVTKNSNTKTVSWTGSSVQILIIQAGETSGTFAFQDNDGTNNGYLYAASSSKNYLRTETTLSANSSWNITITSAGVATIQAQGSNSRNMLRYNSNDDIFSCYSSGQGDVCIYKKVTPVVPQTIDVTLHYKGTSTTISNQTSPYTLPTTGDYVADACDGWTFDGWYSSEYAKSETEPSYITQLTSTGKAYAVYSHTETTEGTPTTTTKTYTHTITAKTWTANGVQALSNVSWTLNNEGSSYFGYDGTKGQQVGSGSDPATSISLTTSGFASATKITAVRVSTSGAKDVSAKVSVKVGSTSYMCNSSTNPVTITATNTQYAFTGSSTGNITISWTQTSSKALYFKTIEVEYQTTSGSETTSTIYYHSTPDCGTPAQELDAPSNLQETITCQGVTLAWGAVTGATKYELETTVDSKTTTLYPTNNSSDLTTGANGKTYTWKVKAVGDGVNYLDSEYSEERTFTTNYTISYEEDGGEAVEDGCGKALPNPLPTTTKTDFNFVGWYTDNELTIEAVAGATITQNTTLYAKWEEIPTTCTITYDANDGTGTAPTDNTEYTNGATVTVVGNYGKLTKDGYAFTGWNTAADGTGTPYKNGDTFTITGNTTLYAQWCEAYWKLVTDASELEDDTRIIIAAKEYDVALSTTQNDNNRGQATITKKYNTVTFGANVQTLSLVGLDKNQFALYTGSGYLYAASSSANQLKTGRTNSGNDYCWSIAINQGAALILAQGEKTHNQIKYNHQQNGQLFSCYESSNTTMSAVAIYKEVCKQDSYNVKEELTYVTAANTNAKTVLATAKELTLKYSADAGYLLPETITVKMGGATLVSGTDYTWDKETGKLTITVTGFYGDIDVTIEAEEDPCYGFAMSTVTSTSTTNSITLTWEAVEDATGYNVKLGTGNFTSATGLTHTFEGLSPKKTYNWEVQTVKDGANFHCEASKTGSTTTQKETFTVSWSVNGNVTSTESVVDGNYITEYPSDPSAPSGCHEKVFVGWTTPPPINTPTNETPATLYKQKSDVPAITAPTTLHAVWADSIPVPGEDISTTETITCAELGYENGAEVTTVNGQGFSINWNKGTNSNAPKYYSTGSAIRAYGGNYFTISSEETITAVALTFASGEGTNEITTNSGTYSNGNWTGSSKSITFTIGGSSGHRRMATIAVTYTTEGEEIITYSAYTTLCDECTPSTLTLEADNTTADIDINGEATITFSTTGGNGGAITYTANPKNGVSWKNGVATFTKSGEYEITASQEKNVDSCPTVSNTLDVTITAIPHLYFVTEPANPIVFDPVECGGNTRVEDKKSVSVQAYNLAAAVTAQVTGPYKIARTSGATLNDYDTKLTLDNNQDGHINGNYDDVYILSFPPAGSSEPTEGTLTFTTTNGNELTVSLSTPTITCTPCTLTFNDRGIKTKQEYYAGTEVPEPATPTGVCGEYEFDGWALAKVESGSTTYEKVKFPYNMPANNQTVLHAVYRYTEGPTNQYELVTEIESGKDYVIAAYDEPNGDFALTNQESDEAGKFNSELVECDANNIITTDNSNIIWTVTGNDEDGYEFYNSAVQKYIEMYRYDGKSLLRLVDNCVNPFYVNIEKDLNNDVTVDITSQVDVTYKVFSFYERLFNVYKSCDYNIYFYEQTATPLYTTTPDCHPSVTLTSDGEVYVTATNGRGIMAATPLTLTTTDLAPNTEIAISSNSNDIYFSTERNTNFAMAQASQPTTSLTLTTNEGGELEKPLYIHYKPSADGNGTPAEVVVTADVSTHNPPFTAQKTIHVRNLPAKFVIATKAGATWYALPANMSGAINPAAVVIEVDETTMTATAPDITPYTLWPVATINGNTDRYKEFGERLRFAAVKNSNKGLWANNADKGTTINNNGAIVARGDNPGAAYEWKVTTTVVDGQWQYTLQTDQTNNQKHLCYRMNQENPAWGTYASNEAQYQLYFLPIKAETTPFDYQVVEWYPNKVLIQTSTVLSSLTAKIAGEKINNVTFERKDANQYEVTGLPLLENSTKALTLEFVLDAVTHSGTHTIPVMLSRGTHNISDLSEIGKEIYNYTNLVVRDNATLTIDGEQTKDNTFYDVAIYPTAKISVPEGKQLSVHRMTFIGGITEVYDGANYTLNKYGVPELSLKGKLGKTVTTMDYVMRVDLDQMYQMGIPYDVDLNNITYWDGTEIKLGDALYVSAYDGQARANRESKTWVYETAFATKFGSATLKAGVGYTISAEPQVQGDKYAILRMPMKSNFSSGSTEAAKSINVVAYANTKGVTITDNHKGWNYLSNPYMTSISGSEADSELVLGYLVETGTGPWVWVNDEIRYVTIPQDNGQDYSQMQFSNAVLKPFKSFFVQIATDGEMSFALASRQNAPARYMEVQTEQEVEFEILLGNEKQADNTGLLIAEQYSPAYEINADLEKMTGSMSVYTIYGGHKLAYNALSPINASEWIPLGYIAPHAGEYTFRIDDIGEIMEQVEHVYIIDYETNNIVDLMKDEYQFTTNKEQNNNRFAINVVLIQDKDNTTTGLDIINRNSSTPVKFVYQDKIYIKSGEVIYDGTGKQVTNINK